MGRSIPSPGTSGGADRQAPARSVVVVTRLLGGLALLASFTLIGIVIAVPTAMTSWIEDGARSIAAAVVAGLIGVAMTAILVLVYARFRLPRLVRAA